MPEFQYQKGALLPGKKAWSGTKKRAQEIDSGNSTQAQRDNEWPHGHENDQSDKSMPARKKTLVVSDTCNVAGVKRRSANWRERCPLLYEVIRTGPDHSTFVAGVECDFRMVIWQPKERWPSGYGVGRSCALVLGVIN
jgi:hypothetical protein